MNEKDLDTAIEKCERIMEFDTRTLKNPESENGWIFDKVYDLLQFLRQFQFATDTNVGGNLIDRQAALDALNNVLADFIPCLIGRNEEIPLRCAVAIRDLPSAQPDVPDTYVGDMISRQAAIETVRKAKSIGQAHRMLLQMPSVTPKQPGWIPCTTETMPKNKSNVLTVIYIPGRQAHIRSGWYEDGLFMNDNGDTWKATDKEVVGWMYQPKLPTPYREGGQS